jgi:casein kinase I family protein HRR25
LIFFVDLNPRDDLESLAYTLLFLLKGSLPWQAHGEHGTALGQIYQVREQKRRWKGSELSKHCPREFRWLVDYARGLKFTEHIPYARVQARFSGVRRMHPVSSKSKG